MIVGSPSNRAPKRMLAIAMVLVFGTVAPSVRAEKAALVFKWAKVTGAVAYVIDISLNRSFSKVVTSQRVSVTSFRLTKHAGAGYWWRVRAIDRDGRFGPYSAPRYAVRQASAPDLLSPSNGKRFTAKGVGTTVQLRWAAHDLLGRYTLEVARDATFKDRVLQRTVRGRPKAAFTATRPGTYYWRVGGVTQTGRAIVPGQTRRFIVAAASPVQLSPRDGARYAVHSGSMVRVPLKFSAVGVSKFLVEVSSDGAGTETLSAEASATAAGAVQTRVTYRVTRPGEFQWRVKGVSPATGWSPRRSFRVGRRTTELAIVTPKAEQVITLQHVGAPKLAATWKAPSRWQRFEVEVTDEGTGERRVYPTTEHHISMSLEGPAWDSAGIRSLRVRGHAGKAKRTAWSPPVSVNVQLPPVLSAPLAMVDGIEAAARWTALPGASGYQAQGCSGQACEPTAPIRKIRPGLTPSAAKGLSLKAVATETSLRWHRLRGVDRWGRPGAWSSTLQVQRGAVDPGSADEPTLSHKLEVGLGVGVLYNFGGMVSPEPRLEVAYWPPVLDQRLGVSISVGYSTASRDLASTDHGVKLSATVHTIPVAVSVATRFGWSPVDLVLGGGLIVTPVQASVDGLGSTRETSSVQWGGGIFAGIEGRLGPGRLFLEVGYARSTATEGLVVVDPSGFTSTIGYRLEVF